MKKRKTPILGWASWNAFRTHINEDIIKDQAKALIDTGLADKGYTYVNIDDGYFGGRAEDGTLLIDEKNFPNGLKPVADYIHSLGLNAGIYSDGGDSTCAYFYDQYGDNGKGVGLYEHEIEDLRNFLLDLDFDFIKVDWCGGLRLDLDEEEQYSKISKIIESIEDEKDRDIIYNICRWKFPGEWVVDVADSWRIGSDIIPTFDSVLYELDSAKPYHRFNGPGHNNDLDMLDVGNGMSLDEDTAHFAMWCLMSSPILIGTDLRKISDELLDVLSNEELIAINQDPASLAAYVVKNITDDEENLLGEVWMKDLGKENSSAKAIAFLNRSDKPLEIEFDFKDAGNIGTITELRNVLTHEDLKPVQTIKVSLRPHQVEVFTTKSAANRKVDNLNKQYSFKPTEVNYLTLDEAKEKVNNGALLVDVRARDEFEQGHLKDAVNIEFLNNDSIPGSYPEDKDSEIILYCKTGKRAEEAAQLLEYYGFNNVYSLGGIQEFDA